MELHETDREITMLPYKNKENINSTIEKSILNHIYTDYNVYSESTNNINNSENKCRFNKLLTSSIECNQQTCQISL